jgi:hypothetical protein
MEVSLEDAYGEACKALGEAVVRERLLLAELARRPHERTQPDQTPESGDSP